MIALVLLAQTVRLAVPYLLAAAGGVISERAGVVALCLEAYLIAGAFGAALGAQAGGPWAGVIAGAAAGSVVASVYAVAALRFRADQVVAGIAVNLVALGLTRYLLELVWGSSSNSPRVPGFPGSADPLLGLVTSPLTVAGLVAMPAAAFVVSRTRFGLRLRAVGELPESAAASGFSATRVRLAAVLLSGAIAGLGGAYLALDQHQFTDGMSAGRGFIALAAIILGRWEPLRAGAACLFFAAAETLQIQLQGTGALPAQLVLAIPYALTLVALAGGLRRQVAPAALGRTG